MSDVTRHDCWIRVSGWEDSRDTATGRRTSSIGQAGDFHASVREHYLRWEIRGCGKVRRPVCGYAWHVVRQRTEREGPDERGRWWTGWLYFGDADTLAHAKSTALKELKRLRSEHIAAGGDVGYGDEPTGDQIREYLASSSPQNQSART